MPKASDIPSISLLRDADDRPLSAGSEPTWAVPDGVRLDGERLVIDWSGSWHEQRADESLLPDFLRLTDGDGRRILAFARQWGVLSLCRHDLPAFHDAAYDRRSSLALDGVPGMLCSAPPRERVELLSSWRDYASWARAMVSLAHRIAIDDPLSDDGAIADYATVWLGRAVSPALAREHIDPRVTPERAGQAVAMRLGDWLALGRVELRVRWSGGFDVALGHDGVPGLFGALGSRLLAAVSGRSLALCHHCGGLYQPSRRPAAGRRSYCPACRQAGAPVRDAKRAMRLRGAAEHAQA